MLVVVYYNKTAVRASASKCQTVVPYLLTLKIAHLRQDLPFFQFFTIEARTSNDISQYLTRCEKFCHDACV
jgi:hypothetical protein